jgi:hypothetical protein
VAGRMRLPRIPKFLVGMAHLAYRIAHVVSPVRPLAQVAANGAIYTMHIPDH